jgi:hypothetical protein
LNNELAQLVFSSLFNPSNVGFYINFNKHGQHSNDHYFRNYRYCGGFCIAKLIEKSNISNLIKNARSSIYFERCNLEAENIKKDKILQAKEKFIELKSEHEQVILTRDKKVAEIEKEFEIKNLKFLMNYRKQKSKR